MTTTPEYLDPEKWAAILGPVIQCRVLPAADSHSFPLGLNPVSDAYLHIRDETERELVFRERFVSTSPTNASKAIRLIYSQHNPTRDHQDSGQAAVRLQKVLWATFTAKYLPSLVNRILDLPPHGARSAEHYGIQNIYHTTLKFTDIAYLAKFMTSSSPIAEGTSYKTLNLRILKYVVFGTRWEAPP